MSSVVDLYEQNPYWLWLGVGALLVLVNLITGFGRLVWPSLAAAAVAAVGLVGARVDLPLEIVIFAVLTLFFLLLPRKLNNPRSAYVPGVEEPQAPKLSKRERRAAAKEVGSVDRNGRLVGRIGKTTSDFANGVGRVWIEGAEWGADLENGEFLRAETPVRVTRVTGGIRLQVRALNS
jgi:membrane protein implicated in regulation of membrane protease activity